MEGKALYFLSQQVFVVPQVIICVIGLVIGLSRRHLGRRARLGILGFGLLLALQFHSILTSYVDIYLIDTSDLRQYSRVALTLGVIGLLLQLAGLASLIAAAFHKVETPRQPEVSVG